MKARGRWKMVLAGAYWGGATTTAPILILTFIRAFLTEWSDLAGLQMLLWIIGLSAGALLGLWLTRERRRKPEQGEETV